MSELERLQRRVERERRARQAAEQIAEQTTRALYARQQELQLLETVATAANQARTLDAALEVAVPALCEHGSWAIAHAWVRSEGGTSLRDSGIWHVNAHLLSAATETLTTSPAVPGGELLERVMDTGEPTWVTAGEDVELPYQALRPVSGFAFPVLSGEHVIAVVELLSRRSRQRDEDQTRLAVQAATHLTRVAERIAAREQIVHQTLHDALTDLPNRVLFGDRLGHALDRSRRIGARTAVLFLDVDRFKLVNDTLGHRAGDQLLCTVAERLRDTIRASDTIARFGGDEFAVLCEDLQDDRDALRIAASVQAALSAPCNLEGEWHTLSTSVGIAVARGREATPESLLRDADAAMYRAKELGRARTEIFDDRLRQRLEERLRVERDLLRGLEQGELRLAYQPVVSLETGRLRSVEALLRWDHPERGLVAPGEFLPIAEESGLILRIGEFVLAEACRQAASWRQRFGDEAPLPIHVNLAARQLSQTSFVDHVLRVLAETGADARDIALEITESAVIESTLLASDMLGDLKAIGFEILLDDFGIGYSSLGYLQQLPIDVLKIDRSFIDALGSGERASAIVRAIVGMADALSIDVVAEGVETDEQAQLSHALGCGLAQGFLFARPDRPEVVEALAGRRLSEQQPA